ncbi:Arginine biosynthesis bifunctional protein ArgJ, mitochondrial [Termitomyces sp. J132]|nr:Arginine biosynthesis bifunctional protein ArgJ, mitochondrial [Termitomyces sp. J132]
MFRRLSSTVTIKPTPSKAHLHGFLPSSLFPTGYLLTGVHAGVKKTTALDVGVILSTSDRPTSAAACFTRNAFKAAPVLVSDEILAANGGRARGIVVNSGCANAVTGQQGLKDAWAMVRATDGLLPSHSDKLEHETLVMSTGVIGQHLPISRILDGISSKAPTSLGADFAAWERAAKAFMTTDTFPKLRARKFTIGRVEYHMAGMDKGAGMIHPDMGPASTSFAPKSLHATLLGCILTDAPVSPRSLQSALTYAVERSFNSISVDGDMSTNDTIIVLANGAAAGKEVKEIDEETDKESYEIFKTELTGFAADLAKLVVRDGEGATKFVTVTVKFKMFLIYATCWGRILAATGSVPLAPLPNTSTPAVIEPTTVSVTFIPSDGSTPLPVLVNGEPEIVDEVRAKAILSEEEFGIEVRLGMGDKEATYWTCDFSYEYVKINGDYRS